MRHRAAAFGNCRGNVIEKIDCSFQRPADPLEVIGLTQPKGLASSGEEQADHANGSTDEHQRHFTAQTTHNAPQNITISTAQRNSYFVNYCLVRPISTYFLSFLLWGGQGVRVEDHDSLPRCPDHAPFGQLADGSADHLAIGPYGACDF